MALEPSINDNGYVLLFKATQNLYEFAVNSGITGVNPPVLGRDTKDILLKKAAYYTASHVDTA